MEATVFFSSVLMTPRTTGHSEGHRLQLGPLMGFCSLAEHPWETEYRVALKGQWWDYGKELLLRD